MLYSNWLDVKLKQDPAQNGGKYYNGTIDAPKLDKKMLDEAEIKVYINLNSTDEPAISPLPYSDEQGNIIRFFAADKAIYIISNVDASTFVDGTDGKKYYQYRYVIIPGGSAIRKAQEINWNNYAEVKAFLGLKD